MQHTRKFTAIIAAILGLSGTLLAHEENQTDPLPYVTLVAGENAGFAPDEYHVPEGYIAEVQATTLVTGTDDPPDSAGFDTQSRIRIRRFTPDDGPEGDFDISLTAETMPSNLPIFLGPVDISVIPEGGTTAFCFLSLKISPLPVESFTPGNTVVIPADSDGAFRVTVESSTDLVNWNEALPGTYDSLQHGRFFRLRILRSN